MNEEAINSRMKEIHDEIDSLLDEHAALEGELGNINHSDLVGRAFKQTRDGFYFLVTSIHGTRSHGFMFARKTERNEADYAIYPNGVVFSWDIKNLGQWTEITVDHFMQEWAQYLVEIDQEFDRTVGGIDKGSHDG